MSGNKNLSKIKNISKAQSSRRRSGSGNGSESENSALGESPKKRGEKVHEKCIPSASASTSGKVKSKDESPEPDNPVDNELAELVKQMTITPKRGGGLNGIPISVLYYGWFFSPSVSASLKLIADKYLATCFSNSENFERFMKSISAKANVADPLSYYTKPVSSSGSSKLMYHVTAKFCGRSPCIPYAQLVNSSIGKEFNLQIIGIFFTQSTFGFRLKLSKSQEIFWDEDRVVQVEKPKKSTGSNEIGSNRRKNQKGKKEEEMTEEVDSEYYGVKMKKQEMNFTPSLSRAHITIGCAPGVKAMQTGFDLLDIISLEHQKTCHHDFEIEGATLRQYGRGNGDAFVLYFDQKYIAKAVFMSVP